MSPRKESRVLLLRRLCIIPCVSLLTFLSCGHAPKTFSLQVKEVRMVERSSSVNVIAAGDHAISAITFAAAVGIHAEQSSTFHPAVPPVVWSLPKTTVPAAAFLQPCGGDLPDCSIVARESGGDYGAYNSTGCGGNGCFGKFQFSGAWAGKLGLPDDLSTATPAQQDAAARELWANGAGCSNWSC